MKSRQFLVMQYLQVVLQANAPKDTWNLSMNGIRIVQENGKFYIAIGGEPAPYAPITNEKWNGRTNPNEGWIQKSIDLALPYIKRIMSGAITENEIRDAISDVQLDIDRQRQAFIQEKLQEGARI